MRKTGLAAVGLVALVAALGTTGVAQADRGSGSGGSGSGSGGDNRTVRIEDDCDPATFNAALGDPNACVGDGDTLFQELIDELIDEGSADKWRNKPDDTHVDDDEGLVVNNQGGEFHTFTEVQFFGAGCVDELNAILGLTGTPAGAACPDSLFSGFPPGGSITISAASLPPGMHLFQCMVHPWMQTTVEVRGHDHH